MTSTKKLLLEAICIEHWARFHFLEELPNANNKDMADELAIVVIPDIILQQCQEDVPHLVALLEKIQKQEISLDSSRDYIFDFILETLPMKPEQFSQEINTIINDSNFARFLDVFNTFVQEEAEKEELEVIPTFLVWMEQFKVWASERNLDEVLGLSLNSKGHAD